MHEQTTVSELPRDEITAINGLNNQKMHRPVLNWLNNAGLLIDDDPFK